MKVERKMKFWGIPIVFLLLCSFLVSCSKDEEDGDKGKVQNYLKEKYEIDAVVTAEGGKHAGNMGNTWHTVQLKDNKHIQFRVKARGLLFTRIVGDEYEYGLKTYEAYKKLKPTIAEMDKLGFSKQKDENIIDYQQDDDIPKSEFALALQSKRELDYSQFDTVELDRFYQLLQLIQENNSNITFMEVMHGQGDSLELLSFYDLQNIKTKEEMLHRMKEESSNYWTYIVQAQVKDKIKEIENERFAFTNIECSFGSSNECKSYSVILQFEEGMIRYKNNPNLTEDLYAVSTFLQTEFGNKPCGIKLIGEGLGQDEINFSLESFKTKDKTEEIVKEYLN